MKVNYDFYKGKDLYSDGEIENDVIEYIKKYKKENYNEIFEEDMRWPIFYHITQIRQNIINWYPFEEDSDVLEIGAGMGAITESLCKKCKSVTSVELSKRRASAIENRCKNYDNLEIIVGNLNDIKFEKKFDYITLIGVLEYANLFTDSDKPFDEFISNIKKLLKDDGKILIAIENKFGMKYFAGAVEDHTSIKYDGIQGYLNKKGPITLGKDGLTNLLKRNGLNHINFYYPLPDYKLPNVIFSDKCLPTKENIENLYDTYYYDNTILGFDEKKAYKEVIEEGKFDFFANSFFVECSSEIINNDIDFALFNVKAKYDNLYMITKTDNNKYYKEKISEKKEKSKLMKIENINNMEDVFNECEEATVIKDFFEKKYVTELENLNMLNLKNDRLKNEVDILKAELEKIYYSRTWKYTNIIRKINKKIKRKKD